MHVSIEVFCARRVYGQLEMWREGMNPFDKLAPKMKWERGRLRCLIGGRGAQENLSYTTYDST